MFNLITSTIFQLLVALVVPIIYYYVRFKTTKKFLQFIGLKKIGYNMVLTALSVGVLLLLIPAVFAFLSDGFLSYFSSHKMLSGNFQGNTSFLKVLYIVIISYFKSGLTEEIFFRGFLGKLFLSKLSFLKANLIQSLVFGIIHLLLAFSLSFGNILLLVFSFLFPFSFAYIGFFVNEKMAKGSILPSVIIHGTVNCIFYLFVAFHAVI